MSARSRASGPRRTSSSRPTAGSPIPEEERDAFTGLPYYPVNVDLVFEGLALQPYTGDEPTNFEIPTSDNRLRPARRAGSLTFDHDGQSLRPDGLRARGRAQRRAGVRAVPRRDERDRDVRRRPLPRPRARRGRDVRARLQPRLPPDLRLLAEVLVPAHARPRTACRCASRPANGSRRAGPTDGLTLRSRRRAPPPSRRDGPGSSRSTPR